MADRLVADALHNGLSIARVDAGSGEVSAEPGITDLAAELASFGDVVHRGARDGLAEVPWGQQQTLDRDSAKPLTLLEALTDIYEVVIVMTGRVGRTSSLTAFSGADCRMVVVGDERSEPDKIEAALSEAAALGYHPVQFMVAPVAPRRSRLESSRWAPRVTPRSARPSSCFGPRICPASSAASRRSKGVIFTLHRVLPEPPAAFSPNAILQVTPGLPRIRHRARPGARPRDRHPRRGRDADRESRAHKTVRRLHLRRRLSRQPRPRAAGAARARLPLHPLHPDRAGRWRRRGLVAGARGRHPPSRPRSPIAGQGETAVSRHRDARPEAGRLRHLYASMRNMPEPERVDVHPRPLRPVRHRPRRPLPLADHGLGRAQDLRRRSALHDRRPHRASLRAEQAPRGQRRATRSRSRSDVIEAQFGKRRTHLSYPIGSPVAAGAREYAIAKDLGFRSAVTTRPGGLYHRHAQTLHALPRISLNGLYQQPRYMDVFATGALFRKV